jgi:hypothetical protein
MMTNLPGKKDKAELLRDLWKELKPEMLKLNKISLSL